MGVMDVIWVTVAAFAGFEVALAANYLFLKYLLRTMHAAMAGPSSSSREANLETKRAAGLTSAS